LKTRHRFTKLAKLKSGELLIQTSYPGSGTLKAAATIRPLRLSFGISVTAYEAGFDMLRVLREKSGRSFLPLVHATRADYGLSRNHYVALIESTGPFYE